MMNREKALECKEDGERLLVGNRILVVTNSGKSGGRERGRVFQA